MIDAPATGLPAAIGHPLDPLSAQELQAAIALVRADARFQALGERVRFSFVTLHEPPKDLVLSPDPAGLPGREVFITLLNRADGAAFEVLVSLTEGAVLFWRQVPGAHPASMLEESIEAELVLKAHPAFLEALARRGITDLDTVCVQVWCAGNFGLSAEQGPRLGRAVSCRREQPGDNLFARPIEGLVALIDLTRMVVLRVDDHGVVPIPPERGNYGPADIGMPLRADLRPLHITQPEGPSFSLDGHLIRWQKWQIRVGFTPREGLVLHTVGYEDAGRLRPILYRAALSEMVVPYGDPNPDHYFKNAFDAGEIGIGASVNSLELGCDCLGEIRYLDVPLVTNTGDVQIRPNAICLHEEDSGLLWKHHDWLAGTTEVRRSRRLVISSVSTVGNYDYAFVWYFYQDGTLAHEVKLTGLLSAGAVAPGQTPRYGGLVAPGLQGPGHQHFFNMRLDLDIEGTANRVYEVHTEPAPSGPENPYHNAFISKRTLLATESEAQQLVDPLAARCWDIVNPAVLNGLGQPVCYRLLPGENVQAMAGAQSSVLKRAGFITRHLWITPYAQDERYAAGDYPHMHAGGAGLPAFTRHDRSITDTDVVLWYTFGHHHVPRPEDFPVMPTASIGFTLKPFGFFDRNPALDVPPSTAQHGHGHGHEG